MSDISDYNRALAAAKVKALEVLQKLLLTCDDPTERRRIAKAILDAKPPQALPKVPVKTNDHTHTQPTRGRQLPPLSQHALGTINLDTQSLAIVAGSSSPLVTDPTSPTPIMLTPSDEPPQIGGPVTTRPLPLPLGPPRA